MGKYDPLKNYLINARSKGDREIVLPFDKIEELLTTKLPPTARVNPKWWGNEDLSITTHVQCQAWENAGWTAEPDITSQRVRFVLAQSFG